MKKILYITLLIVLAVGCEKKAEHILTSGKMEDVLYDYHMAQAMLEQLPYEERDNMSQAYIDAVFEKHHITEEDFDSSIVYYNRNALELKKIYSNIQDRLTEVNQELSLATGNTEMAAVFSQNGDTANIWNAPSLSVLRSKEGVNFETFSIPADSSFYKEDRFILVCTPIILRENPSDHDGYVMVGFTVNYADGSSMGRSMKSNDTRNLQLDITAKEGKTISSVSGYFYYKAEETFRNLALVSDIGVIRMHATKTEVIKTDSIKNDSIIKDTLKNRPHERLTPEQLRKQNQKEDRIDIKAAPDVRTPNSFGPRRRISKSARQRP